MKTENPIILNTGGIDAVSIDMTHTNCACKLICDCCQRAVKMHH